MKSVGLFFGSFNPIHVGHLIIANHFVNASAADEVWMVVSPQNPTKTKESLLADIHRLALVREAVEDNPKLKASNIEFGMPRPSYTADTLVHLSEKYPDIQFSLIMGEDNLRTFHKWKNHEAILEHHQLLVYPREKLDGESGEKAKLANHPKVQMIEVPLLNIAASQIREMIKLGQDVRYMLTQPVARYVDEMGFYR